MAAWELQCCPSSQQTSEKPTAHVRAVAFVVFIIGHLCRGVMGTTLSPSSRKWQESSGQAVFFGPSIAVSSYPFREEGPKANLKSIWLSFPKYWSIWKTLTLRSTESKSFPAWSFLFHAKKKKKIAYPTASESSSFCFFLLLSSEEAIRVCGC